ncbi:MAG: hypothetical protein H0T60_10365 [Acidobacteria bacterium]|nr:hypothetical protein [Acidobacteriota bacterium]
MNPYESGPFGADPMPPLPLASEEELRDVAAGISRYYPGGKHIIAALRYCAAMKERAATTAQPEHLRPLTEGEVLAQIDAALASETER